jgi:hypothetical protein
MPTAMKLTCHQILREDGDMRIPRLFKRLRRWSSQAFRKRHSPVAFRACRNAGNTALTAEGITSKGTGSISCEVEFCIFYRLSLRTLRTKDVRYTEDLYDLLDRPPILKYMKFERLGWAGHMGRMDNATVPIKVLNVKFHGRRPVERPRLRWEENIRRDSSVLLNI